MYNAIKSLGLISTGIALTHLASNYIPKMVKALRKGKAKASRDHHPFVVVVGIGGVGSHAIMSLIRSGIKHIRVIDYDICSLSSVNRHAFALRKDVGRLKANLVVEYARQIDPEILIETVDDAFLLEYADKYIAAGNPDFVVDCIDDINSKIELIHYCVSRGIKIICSMGAAGKNDASSVRYVEFDKLKGDNMAKSIRYQYKKKYNNEIPNMICVYSGGKNVRGLSELQEHQKGNVELYRVNFNERVRTLPVFACLPAAFGQCLAMRVLGEINHYHFESVLLNVHEDQEKDDEVLVGNITLTKLIKDYKGYENRKRKEKNICLIYEDYLKVAKAFDFCSCISKKQEGKLRFFRWRPFNPPGIGNLVLVNKAEINQLYSVKTDEDLVNTFGKENVEKIDKILSEIVESKNK